MSDAWDRFEAARKEDPVYGNLNLYWIKKSLASVPEGPWHYEKCWVAERNELVRSVVYDPCPADPEHGDSGGFVVPTREWAQYIADSRTNMEKLVSEVEFLRGKVDDLLSLLALSTCRIEGSSN